jgi:SAM-dependent methyltransferase
VQYSDEDAAALYDLLNPWGASDDFYLALVMEAGSVLDVGCGTGALLRRARDAGHAGRLCGVDPDRASLAVARRGGDIEWVAGTAAAMTFESEFALALMTGHAFQFLVDDDEVRASLAAIRRALVDGGRFAFETRNPLARAWESWTPANAIEIVDPAGRQVRVSYEVESVVDDLVTLTETTSDQRGVPLRVDRATLRFLDIDTLARFLATAGFQIESQYGDWSREPLDTASAEIITVARVPRKYDTTVSQGSRSRPARLRSTHAASLGRETAGSGWSRPDFSGVHAAEARAVRLARSEAFPGARPARRIASSRPQAPATSNRRTRRCLRRASHSGTREKARRCCRRDPQDRGCMPAPSQAYVNVWTPPRGHLVFAAQAVASI